MRGPAEEDAGLTAEGEEDTEICTAEGPEGTATWTAGRAGDVNRGAWRP